MTEPRNLLPCPFCGGAPEMDTQQGYRSLSGGRIGSAVAIYCTVCSAQHSISREDVRELSTEEIVSIVTDAWNKRTPLINGESTQEKKP